MILLKTNNMHIQILFNLSHSPYYLFLQVLHSQRLNDKPLRPWIVAEKDGPIIAEHCTCMAGLGETCTHVASLLFYVEAVIKLCESRTVPEVAAYWMPQSCLL